MLDNQVVNSNGPNDDRSYILLPSNVTSTVLDLKNDAQGYQPSLVLDSDPENMPLTFDMLPYSTPGPRNLPILPPELHMISDTSQVNDEYLKRPPGFEELGSASFSTPGPGSTIGYTSGIFPPKLLPIPDLPSDCLAEINASASPACNLTLPPYIAVPSDPAPAYSSDDFFDGTYYEDPLTDESGSEPPADPQIFDNDFLNMFATPGPGFCAFQPIYFKSPTEDPSDSDPSEPGYKIDLDAIDFKWTPFDRKSIRQDVYTHDDIEPHMESLQIHPSREDCAEFQLTNPNTLGLELPEFPLPPSCMLSPSPFRFTPLDLTVDISEQTSSYKIQEQIQPPIPELPRAFAPAPGIYVSPLRGEPDSKSSIPQPVYADADDLTQRTPDNGNTRMQHFGPNSPLPNSQASNDSIQSWLD
ncbi:hypothetical protein C0991_002737 [Blastosporella zonata]|nr:hypothetical protein C0991_002737 [Blastosporella zonata]